MAIKNASDLLVYAKTTDPAKQKTRIYVKTVDPITLADGDSFGTLKIDNITDASGAVFDDVETSDSIVNTATSVLDKIDSQLTAISLAKDYTAIGSQTVSGDYTYQDFENGSNGIVPTLVIKNGQATINEGAIIIEIITPGSSAIFDPVAFSTSASFSTNMDLRDVTNKDSDGWSESLGGLKSFEVSTDILQSINPDVPLDGTDFFDKLKQRSLVDLSFSDRIRNILRTNLTQSGVDEFTESNDLSQANLQADPFGGTTASLIEATTASQDRLEYHIDAARLEGKKLTWSFYVKESTSDIASFYVLNINSSFYTPRIISGNGSEEIISIGGGYYKITNLDSTWCRVALEFPTVEIDQGDAVVQFRLYPGLADTQSSDSIFTSSWQIELSPEATDYQDPTDITHWQGNALVSSVSFDAGVEDNLTCSATFTGTGNVYPNGLGPELIGDTGFDDPNYWTYSGGSTVVEDGYGKIITTGAIAYITKDLGLYSTPGDFFSLTYTVHTSTQGGLAVHDGWEANPEIDMRIPSSVGTHTVLLKPGQDNLEIKRSSGATTIWLSSISLKKVL
jgi:hypothetical protein